MRGRCLRGRGNGLVLQHGARTRIGHEFQALARAELVLPGGAQLALAHAFARIEAQRAGRGLAGVGLELGACQAQRVLGAGALLLVLQQPLVISLLARQFHVGRTAVCGRLGAHAVSGETLDVDGIAPWGGAAIRLVRLSAPDRSAQLGGQAPQPVRPHGHAAAPQAGLLAVFGVQQQCTACAVAVEHGGRAAHHVQARGVAQREVGGLALAIGRACRNAVHVQAQAAHAKGGARTEAAHRDLQVLGEVLAVQHHQARHARQAFGQVDLHLPLAQHRAVHAVDGGRGAPQVGAGAGLAGRDDHGGEQGLAGVLRCVCRLGGQGVQRAGQCGAQGGQGGPGVSCAVWGACHCGRACGDARGYRARQAVPTRVISLVLSCAVAEQQSRQF
ncbi:MAG: hypothetical protein GAK34_03506 [Delftia tsuruhatensis]|nr:MAG: hypothetical protein GAK34_03506 [Delftia tsuruhatensis]